MFLLLVATYFCAPIHHPNFYFQLTLGNWIRHNGQLPVEDLWSAAGSGATYYADTWLFAAAVSMIEQFWGASGLLSAKLMLYVTFVGLVASALSARAGSRFIGAALTAIVAAAVFERGSFEPSVLGWGLFFFCLQLSSLLFASSRFNRDLSRLLLLLVLYVNVHPSAYLAIGWIVFSVLTSETLSSRQKAVAALAALAAVFCTPYFGFQLLPSIGAFLSDTAHNLLVHPRAGTVFHYSIAFVVLLWVLLLLCLHQAPAALKPREIALPALLTLAAFMCVDYAPYAIIGLAYALAGVWGLVDAGSLGNLGRGVDALQRRTAGWDLRGIIWVLFCLVMVNGVQLWRLPLSLAGYPIKSFDYLVDREIDGPVLIDSRFAPYAAYRTAGADGLPAAKPVFDPRTPALNLELGNLMALFERSGKRPNEYLTAKQPRVIVCQTQSLLCELAVLSSRWNLVFEWFKPLDDPEPLPQALRRGSSWQIFLLTEH